MWPYPKVLAHRGGGKLAPENTLAALRCGLMHGFRAVEFDVMLAKDGIPVLMHDPHLGRTIAGAGAVAAFSAQELAKMDAGSWFSPEFAGEPVASLAEVIAFCKANRLWMNIEIKPAPGFEQVTGQVVAALTRQCFAPEIAGRKVGIPAISLPLFSSFSLEALQAAQRTAPEIARAWLVDTVPSDWQASLTTLGAVALHTNHRHLYAAQAQAIKQAGFGLLCYTVNDPGRAREILAWGVDALCTDRIDVIGADFR